MPFDCCNLLPTPSSFELVFSELRFNERTWYLRIPRAPRCSSSVHTVYPAQVAIEPLQPRCSLLLIPLRNLIAVVAL